MTDQELKDLVAGLAVAQDRTEKFMAESAKRFEIESQKRAADFEAHLAAQRVAHDRIDAQMAKTDEQISKMQNTLKSVGVQLGGISNNMGYTTEEYFYNSLVDEPVLNGIKFDKVQKNIKIMSKRIKDEFDLVLYNGDTIALIECKYKAHEKDIDAVLQSKVANFKALNPDYAGYKYYLGIASFYFYPELEQYATEKGFIILKQKGEYIEVITDNLKVF
jgi:uncharacterized coiled-coil protein SlyX